MAERQNISSGAPWESKVGYSRAVRCGDIIEVSGTTATKDGEVQHKGDMYQQTRLCISIIENALIRAGVTLQNVVRTRIYVTDISKWEDAARAHSEFFDSVRPATTMVEVSKLIHPDMLVEIEATAVISKH